MERIKNTVREYILSELNLPVLEEELQHDTPLLSSRLIDSISTLLLVEFLEKTFQVEFKPHEVNQDNLDSLDLIEEFVLNKKGERA
jgi:acyl carrier protein